MLPSLRFKCLSTAGHGDMKLSGPPTSRSRSLDHLLCRIDLPVRQPRKRDASS